MDTRIVADMLWATVGFLFNHWNEVLTVGTALWLLAKGQAKKEAFQMALDAVRKVADAELSNSVKRASAVGYVVENLPQWAKPFVSETRVVDLVEDAWIKHVKPEIR